MSSTSSGSSSGPATEEVIGVSVGRLAPRSAELLEAVKIDAVSLPIAVGPPIEALALVDLVHDSLWA